MVSIREQFEQQGFLVQRGVLDPGTDLQPLAQEYTRLIVELARLFVEEAGIDLDVTRLSLPEQYCVMIGASRGTAMHHLDPALNIFAKGYRWRPELPDARTPEMFRLLSHPRILDIIEELVGPEITASPIYHVNQKPAAKHLELAAELAKSGGSDVTQELFFNFQIGRTSWHMDAIAGLPDSHDSHIVNAWIPMTPATEENGCLMVIPGSHRNGVKFGPHPTGLDEDGLRLEANPGDVILLHNKTLHASVANRSADQFRWAFNFRYLPTGQPTGRPYLPAFTVRSRSNPAAELHDSRVWSEMWRCALDYLAAHGTPTSFAEIRHLSLEQAREITHYWRKLTPDPQAWLRLGKNLGD